MIEGKGSARHGGVTVKSGVNPQMIVWPRVSHGLSAEMGEGQQGVWALALGF